MTDDKQDGTGNGQRDVARSARSNQVARVSSQVRDGEVSQSGSAAGTLIAAVKKRVARSVLVSLERWD